MEDALESLAGKTKEPVSWWKRFGFLNFEMIFELQVLKFEGLQTSKGDNQNKSGGAASRACASVIQELAELSVDGFCGFSFSRDLSALQSLQTRSEKRGF